MNERQQLEAESILAIVRDWYSQPDAMGRHGINDLRPAVERFIEDNEAFAQGKWIPVSDGLPGRERSVPLLVGSPYGHGHRFWEKAIFAEEGTLPLGDDQDPFEGCVLKDDQHYVPAGWYVYGADEEVLKKVDGFPIAWLDMTFPKADGSGLGKIHEGVRADLRFDKFSDHYPTPWKVVEREYDLWGEHKGEERMIATAWIHGQLKQEALVITQAGGAKDGQLRIHMDKSDAEFIVEAANSYYRLQEENAGLKLLVQKMVDAMAKVDDVGLKKALELAEARGIRPQVQS